MHGESTELEPRAAGRAAAFPDNRDPAGHSGNPGCRGAGRPPDTRRQEQRRREILEAATSVFARIGFAATDVQEIASVAGVGKGTVYRYFPSKEELFLATVDLGMQRLTATVDLAAARAAEPLARVAAAIEAYLAYFDQHPEMIELFIQERAHFRHRQQAIYFVHRAANLGPWRALLLELVRDGLVRDLPVDSLLDVISDLIYGAIFTQQISGREASLASQSEAMLQVIWHGILAAPPVESGLGNRAPADRPEGG